METQAHRFRGDDYLSCQLCHKPLGWHEVPKKPQLPTTTRHAHRIGQRCNPQCKQTRRPGFSQKQARAMREGWASDMLGEHEAGMHIGKAFPQLGCEPCMEQACALSPDQLAELRGE